MKMKTAWTRNPARAALLAACAVLSANAASATDEAVVRTPIPDPKFPIAAAVTVPPGYSTVYLSGALPDVANPDAPKGTVEAYGNTETQTASVLKKLGASLTSLGLTFADVVSAHVFLVGDPGKNGEIDFAGMNAAFSKEFGTEAQPNKPARAAVKVAGLVIPGTLVEIEMIAAVKPASATTTKAKTKGK